MERRVIHLNIADFGVAVERLLDSALRKVPLILAHRVQRSVVFDMSEEAYRDGVRKGMGLNIAQKRCRRAMVLSPRPEKYQQVLGRCIDYARNFSPLVERAEGSGHLYLDVTGTSRLFGPPSDIGWRLRKTIRRDLGLDPIWSLAPNKLMAKVASRLVKPCGEYVVADGEESILLDPLPLYLLPGISVTDLARFRAVHLDRVHQVKALTVQELSVLLDGRAQQIYRVVRGIDHTPVQPGSAREAGGFEHVFTPDTNSEQAVRGTLAELVSRAGYWLRARGVGCRKVTVELTYTDGIQAARTATAEVPIIDDRSLETLAVSVLHRAWRRRVRLRRIFLGCSRCSVPARQLGLFKCELERVQKNNMIDKACDAILERYGAGLIRRGAQVERPSPPLPRSR